MRRSAFTCLILAAVAILVTGKVSLAQFAGGGPKPGDVYKEFAYSNTTSNWRVTDPGVDLATYPEAAAFLPNPVLRLSVDDLQHAVRAEVVIDFWGGHEGTINKQFRFNGNPWIMIPELDDLGTVPSLGEKYMQQVNHLITVPLEHLRVGENTIEGTSGPNGWDWGQWGWYGLVLRIYYDPASKPHATGQITYPASGSLVGDNPTLQIQTSGSVNRVDYLAWYDGYDTDGDGVYADWQRNYHRRPWTETTGIKNHVGTATTSPFQVTWDTQWVPDQDVGQVRLIARVRDTNGVWFVTDEVSNLSLQKSQSVRLYKPTGVPQLFWVRAGETKSCKVYIPTLANAVDAVMLVKTWNGNEAGATFYSRVNGWTAPKYGLDHLYSYDVVPVPLSALTAGDNTLSFYSATEHHGMEILWPGPAIMVRYGQASQGTAPSITSHPGNQSALVGESVTFTVAAAGATPLRFQWKKNGADILGADAPSYTTVPITLADNGAVFSCTVSNDYGTVTSSDAVLTVTAASAPTAENIIVNPGFESGTSSWNFYTSGTGAFDTPTPGYEGARAGCVRITTPGSNTQLYQYNLPLEPNVDYELVFAAYSNTGHDVKVSLQKHGSPYTNYGLNKVLVNLQAGWQVFTLPFRTQGFTAPVSDARLMFWFSDTAAANDVFYFDQVVLQKKAASTVLYPLTLDVSGSGGVSLDPAGGAYAAGTVVGLTAVPSAGWEFAGWSGALSGVDPSASLTITGDTQVGATFVPRTYSLTVSQVGEGTIQVDPSKSAYAYGETVTLTATPDTDWTFAGWDGGSGSAGTWWNSAWACRVPVTVDPAGYQRFSRPVETFMNFTAMLAGLNRPGTFDPNSIRVVEVDAGGTVVDPAVPFQFDAASDFDPAVNATGTLVFLLTGTTPAGVTRTFHVYFDVVEAGIAPADIPAQVNLTDDVMDEGLASYRIQTTNATYFYQKSAGGISSLLDVSGRDWIGYNTTVGSAGSYRGIPNLVYPEGYFHPGSTASTSSIVVNGPVKKTIRTVTNDGKWEALWEFYPSYATMTVLRADHAYWFLYEGTPGGALDSADFMVRSTGTQTLASASWTGDITNAVGEEWIYFTDPDIGGQARSLFLVHHQDDTYTDSYWPMEGNMTVFGFGRSNLATYMTQVPNRFTIGFVDTAEFSAGSSVIRSACKPLNAGVGSPQKNGAGPLTLVINGDITVVGTFVYAPPRTLTVQAQGSGAVTLNPPGGTYPQGSVVQLTATASSGWQFSGWSGSLTGTANPASLMMDGDKNVTANFTPLPSYTLSLQTSGSGVVNLNPAGGTYLQGTPVQLTATASSGWQFSGWSGSLTGTANPAVLTMDGNKSVTATFTEYIPPQVIISDDFNTCGLDTGTWTFVNPLGDGTFALSGGGTSDARLSLSVPAGRSHDPWVTNPTARMMQAVEDLDFEMEVKFESVPTQKYQIQGIMAEQDAQNWVRFDFYHDGTKLNVFAAATINGAPKAYINKAFTPATPLYMRVKRQGDQWTQWTSTNGVDWTQSGTFMQAINVTAVGPFVGNHGVGTAVPAFTAVFDYFFNVNAPIVPEDGGLLPQKTLNLNAVGGGTVTADPQQSTYSCGQAVQLVASPVPGWQFSGWSGDLTGSDNPAVVTMDTDKNVTATFTESPVPQGIVSDDFRACQLNGGTWSFVNPLGDGSYTLDHDGPNNTRLALSVPAGTSHDPWATNPTARMTQAVENGDFQVEVKFESVPNQRYQMQGIIAEQNASNWVRFDFYHDGTKLNVFAAATINGTPRAFINSQVAQSSPLYMRVKREGNLWTQSYSTNGVDWTTSGSFTQAIQVSAVGPFVGNHGTGGVVPAYTALVDYFFNTAQPIAPEDGATLSQVNLDTEVAGSGTIIRDPDQTSYNCGQKVQLLAVPSAGWQFAGWTGGLSGYSNPATITMDGDETVTATFTSGTTYSLTVQTAGSGLVAVNPLLATYPAGTVVQLLATPSTGWRFGGWSGSLSGTANPATLTMDGNKTVTATFLEGSAESGPVIDVWYGPYQVFGEPGVPQYWANVLGKVSDPDGVTFLTYSLNGGPERLLSMGPFRRLQDAGDFNVEMAFAELQDGVNDITIRATDSLGNLSVETVSVDYPAGNIAPQTSNINWSLVSDLQSVVQIVDGKWQVASGAIRPTQIGYDRGFALGDLEWKDFEVTVPITVHNYDNRGFESYNYRPSLGFILRWRGHYDWDGSQPRWGYTPVGGGPWYEFRPDGTGSGDLYVTDFLQLDTPHPGNPVTFLQGVPYIWKARVQTIPALGSHYSFKVWQSGTSEPAQWQVTGLDPQDIADGSLLFLAHYVDASFGNISVIPTADSSIPVIDQVQVSQDTGFAVVTWRTNVPSTSVVRYGLTTSYEGGTVQDPVLKTEHSITLPALVPDSVYHYQIAGVNSQGFESGYPDMTFRAGGASTIRSDDFSGAVLNASLWSFINPLGDAILSMTGTQAAIYLPPGASHDLWAGGNLAARLMQQANDTDFEIEVKFDSAVTAKYQMQGVIVQQDAANFLRFDFYHDGASQRIFAASFVNGVPTVRYNQAIAGTAPRMRIKRAAGQWTQSYSPDGVTWTAAGNFTHNLAVTMVGPFAGNQIPQTGSPAPTFTCLIDYFFNTSSPVVPEDGQ
ncbi:MAG: hypothetical protein GX443_00180 [Deltaproteobacteria bacterium]|nr:hypothetical protein [Deltaproteobacteria bacterium]